MVNRLLKIDTSELTLKASRYPYINVESTTYVEVSNKNFQVVYKTVTLSGMIPMDNEVNGVVCQLIRPNIEVDAALTRLI